MQRRKQGFLFRVGYRADPNGGRTPFFRRNQQKRPNSQEKSCATQVCSRKIALKSPQPAHRPTKSPTRFIGPSPERKLC